MAYQIETLHADGEIRDARALLEKEGLQLDNNIDETIGIYDGRAMIATGSIFGNTMRCLAVDDAFQGEGLLNVLVTHLRARLFEKGFNHVFLYTRPEAAQKMAALGFYEIAYVDDSLVFMENKRDGFSAYLDRLSPGRLAGGASGSILMNANPLTKGHLYLIETAARAADRLHLFVVSEDRSFFPFPVRKRLIEEGVRHLDNVFVYDTGSYLISSSVFPSYFLKEEERIIQAQAKLDALLFVRVADRLNITERFVGNEPFSSTTRLYNCALRSVLPRHGIRLTEIPRVTENGRAISATDVRRALRDGDMRRVRALVPDTTYDFLTSEEGRALVRRGLSTGNPIEKDEN